MIYHFYEYAIEAMHVESGTKFPVYFGAIRFPDKDTIIICMNCDFLNRSKPYIFHASSKDVKTWDDFKCVCCSFLERSGCLYRKEKWSWNVKGAEM